MITPLGSRHHLCFQALITSTKVQPYPVEHISLLCSHSGPRAPWITLTCRRFKLLFMHLVQHSCAHSQPHRRSRHFRSCLSRMLYVKLKQARPRLMRVSLRIMHSVYCKPVLSKICSLAMSTRRTLTSLSTHCKS